MATERDATKSRITMGVQSAFGTTATVFGTEHPLLEGGGQLAYTYEEEDDRSISQVGAPETDLESEASAGQLDFYLDANKGDRNILSLMGEVEKTANGTIFENYYSVDSTTGEPLTIRKYTGDVRFEFEDCLVDTFTFSHESGKSATYTCDYIGQAPTNTLEAGANSLATRTKVKSIHVDLFDAFGIDVLDLVKGITITVSRNYDRNDFHLGPIGRGEPVAGDMSVEISLDMRWIDEVYDVNAGTGLYTKLKSRAIGAFNYRMDNGLAGDNRRATHFHCGRVQVMGEPLTGDTSGPLPATIRMKALDATVAIDDVDLLGTGAGTGNPSEYTNCPIAIGRLGPIDVTTL